jgi:bifunctional non-homologous end joining protein LigD
MDKPLRHDVRCGHSTRMPTMADRSPADTQRLKRYAAKRNFAITSEPGDAAALPSAALSFVVQKHWASRLHYDFRLELDGVLLSWAVPKGPCYDPSEKRMAIHVEDHPVAYGAFEGTIPARQYGAGTVIVWDRGTWEPVADPRQGLAAGKLLFKLHGEKLAGLWELVRIAKPGDKQDPWMLFKKRDEWARPLNEYDVLSALPDSVIDKPLGPIEERASASAGSAPSPALAKAVSLARPPGVKSPLPATLAPQLATLADAVPQAGAWSYEIKFDGYRLLARIDDKGRARLFTRQGNDWTGRTRALAAAVEALGTRSTWLDGEIVVLNAQGTPEFNLLQNAFDASRTDSIDYFVFDLPFFKGHDLRQVPLQLRRELLRQLFEAKAGEHLRYSADFSADLGSLLESARVLGLEGVIAKRVDAPYVSRRSPTWLKLKCTQRQEFVIGGFADRAGSSAEVGALMLGYHDDTGALQYCGNVGTGWDAETAVSLRRRLGAIEVEHSPFALAERKPSRWSRKPPGGEHWVKPTLVAEVSFGGWTPEGSLRHAVFQGLRMDKPARAVARESSAPAAKQMSKRSTTIVAKVSHPERVIDPSTGLKKLDLVRYYESIALWMMPHLARRPVSLLRGPTGIEGQLFFQKHDNQDSIPGMRKLDPELWPGHPAMLEVPSAEELVSAAQMNVIEFHTWNSTTKHIDKPDRMVFDLDPGSGVSWSRVQEAATLTHTMLTELGLHAWLKTSGGKGLHIVVPMAPRLPYDTVRAFSEAVVLHLARTIPSRFVARSGPANRVGKVYVDYLRNGHGATTAAALSARARPGLGVSMPVSWEQLPKLKGGAQWTIANARDHLSFQKIDPWADYWTCRQTLTAAMKVLGFKPMA